MRVVCLSALWIAHVISNLALGADIRVSEVPRTVLALYDSRVTEHSFYTTTHLLAEMPLNHLGLKVRYIDVNDSFPDPDSLTEVRGILMWMESGEMKDPERFLTWAESVVSKGKFFVLIGEMAFASDLNGEVTPEARVNGFLGRIGLRSLFDWTPITYDVELELLDSRMVEFERKLAGVIPPFERIQAVDPKAEVFLQIKESIANNRASRRNLPRKTSTDLVVITSNGGLVAPGYTHFIDTENDRKSWILNPFEFFRKAYRTDGIPKPDTTTLSGRRIYYSHIDGDGWRNISTVPMYVKRPTISAEVILKDILETYSDLPVTVGPVVADLHPEWFGHEEDREVARRIFALSHIELGSHTFSHPFDWRFFEDGDSEKELPFLSGDVKSWRKKDKSTWLTYWSDLVGGNSKQIASEHKEGGYETPRAFAVKPFDLKLEIKGASEYLETLAPPGKKVHLIQWSGNTLPFEEALRDARKAGLSNINGGDTRFDRDFASVAWVAPVGRQVGSEYQIYASNSNENTYTDLWNDRYFGFIHLIRTFENTETPIRLKPLNVYYHMYSGEKLSSLNAVRANLNYIRKQTICPVAASRFASIGAGFFSTRFQKAGPDLWEISDRGRLQTIRFDNATFKRVDFQHSRGVIGQKHYQGSLYVALDRSEKKAVIGLTSNRNGHLLPISPRPYLIDGRWEVWNLKIDKGKFSFKTQGFGPGILSWKVPAAGSYEVTLKSDGGQNHSLKIQTNDSGILNIPIESVDNQLVWIETRRVGD